MQRQRGNYPMQERRLTRRQTMGLTGLAIAVASLTGCGAKRGRAGKVTEDDPSSVVEKPMGSKGILVDHPLLNQLQDLDKEALQLVPSELQRLPGEKYSGLDGVGLILNDHLDEDRYWCTPVNCRTFAHTGGNGVHFSFLVRDGKIDQQSPVVLTNPAAGVDDPNWIVGENLYDFLCFGMYRGYFALEQLGYKLDLTLEVYTNPDWVPTQAWHDSVGYAVGQRQKQLLDLLIARFKLRPWKDAKKFHDLQRRLGPLLEIPPDRPG